MHTERHFEIASAAYRKAWHLMSDDTTLTPDERDNAPRLLQDHILRLVNEGESDPAAIAHAAVGHLRQREQVRQSETRVNFGSAAA